MHDAQRIRSERGLLREKYGVLFEKVSAILFDIDPMGINLGFNTDEYEPEVSTILLRLESCHSVEDALQVIHQEFGRWFTPGIAGSELHYQQAAERIWAAWQHYQTP